MLVIVNQNNVLNKTNLSLQICQTESEKLILSLGPRFSEDNVQQWSPEPVPRLELIYEELVGYKETGKSSVQTAWMIDQDFCPVLNIPKIPCATLLLN